MNSFIVSVVRRLLIFSPS